MSINMSSIVLVPIICKMGLTLRKFEARKNFLHGETNGRVLSDKIL